VEIKDSTNRSRQRKMRRPFERMRDDLSLQAIPGTMIGFGRIAPRWLAQAQPRRLFDALNVFS
jgi:hypothetical protein